MSEDLSRLADFIDRAIGTREELPQATEKTSEPAPVESAPGPLVTGFEEAWREEFGDTR